MKILRYITVAALAALILPTARARQAIDYVNPMIGATTADESGRGDVNELGITFQGVFTHMGIV